MTSSRTIALALTLAACRSDHPPDHSAPPSPTTAQTTPPAAAPRPAPHPAPPAAPPAIVHLVATSGPSARLIELDATTARVTATIPMPSSADSVVWTGADPIAVLTAMPMNDGDDERFIGTVGTITPTAFVTRPPIPAASWPATTPAHIEPGWQVIEAAGDPWLSRCTAGGIEDGGHCDGRAALRLGGAFELAATFAPVEPTPLPWPTIAPPADITLTFGRKPGDEHAAVMACTRGGTSAVYPAQDSDPPVDPDSLAWVSTAPPMFVVDQIVDGYQRHADQMLFEGCAPSQAFEHVHGIAGPDGTFALYSSRALSLRRGGVELARLPGADNVVFAPTPATAHRDRGEPLDLVARELAGDTSMFADDAIVLAPATIAARAFVPPAGLTRARIAHLDYRALGEATGADTDARWLAAEVIATAGRTRTTYRLLELVRAGKVVVASFGPLAPLAARPTAPPMPAPTAAGPLAAIAARPYDAAGAYVALGTDPPEYAASPDAATSLLASWGALHLKLDPAVHEVHTATWGYAIATVAIGTGRMSALILGAVDHAGAWHVAAIHYLAL